MSNFPVTDGRRLGLHMSSTGHTVSLGLAGAPSGPVVFDVPAFVNNIAGTSTGQVNEAAGTVTIAAGTKNVTVRLRHLQLTPAATSLRIDPASAIHAGAGGAATVTATFADSGPGADRDLRLAVQAPAGWHVTPVGSPTAASVAAGTTFTGRWRVTSPQDHTNTAMLTAVASYTDATTGGAESRVGSPANSDPGGNRSRRDGRDAARRRGRAESRVGITAESPQRTMRRASSGGQPS
jgi:NPCBM-associated, NEW3 domain of alpha-galactosidase